MCLRIDNDMLKETIGKIDSCGVVVWFLMFYAAYFGRETFVNTFMLQISVLSNHLNGRDTHVRQIKLYGPRPCVCLSFP